MKHNKFWFILIAFFFFFSSCLVGCNNSGSQSSQNNISKAQVDELLASKQTLSFNENGDFKVLILADVHASGTLSEENEKNIKTLIDRENPQFVIFTGDNTSCRNVDELRITLDSMVGYIEEKEIPWCHVYGNHDEDGGMTKEEMQVVYESYDYCLSKRGDTSIWGVGNYVLPVYKYQSNEIGFFIWCLDSGAYLSEDDKENLLPVASTDYKGHQNSIYDYIKADQINWYYNSSVLLENYFGTKIPSMMAFHIPLQENYYAWLNRNKLPSWDGTKMEEICASAINSGLFYSLVERGDVKAVVTGHDHTNDYMFEYNGVKLCSSPTVTTNTYYNEAQMGGRVFSINETDTSYVDTYVQYLIERLPAPDASEYEVFENGTIVSDFESIPSYIHATEFDSSSSSPDVKAEVVSEKGVNNSNALAITKTTATNNGNGEVDWVLDTYGKLGNNNYLVVWLDLTGQDIKLNFRKACFGVVTNLQSDFPYRTDEKDGTTFPLYYLEDGTTEWKTLNHGNDGCFGKEQNSSVLGAKGYFAIRLSDMKTKSGDMLEPSSLITGIYFYFSFSSTNTMKGQYVYLDNVSFVEDYKNIN